MVFIHMHIHEILCFKPEIVGFAFYEKKEDEKKYKRPENTKWEQNERADRVSRPSILYDPTQIQRCE